MKKIFRPLVITIYALAMAYAVVMGVAKPFYNWDMLGYTGSVISWSEHNHEAIYTKTMDTVKASVPDWVYKQYMENELSADAEGFVQQLPLYQVKPLYTGSTWLVHQFGPTLPNASSIVSSISIALLAVLLFCWKPRYMNESAWLLAVLGLSFAFPYAMASLAQSSTPDALCLLFVAGMVYGWVYRRSFAWFAACALLAQLTRPDALLMTVSFAVYFALMPKASERMDKIKAGVLSLVLVATYMTVSKLGGNYGLERWFIYAFVDKNPFPGDATDHLTLAKYWEVTQPAIVLFVERPRTIAMIVWSLLGIFFYCLKPAEGNKLNFHILLLSWLALAVRFVMFPGWGEDRYYFVYFIVILYAGGEMMAPYLSAARKAIRSAHEKIVQTDT